MTGTLWNDAFRRLRRSKLSMLCFGIIVLYSFGAIYGEIIYRHHKAADSTASYNKTNVDHQYLPPVSRDDDGEHFFMMGSDGLGRDVFARLIQGTRIAFLVGIVTSLIAIPIGVILGCLAGYYGGKVDDFIVWLYTIFASIPGLLFVLSIAMVVGKGLMGVCLGIGLTTWVSLCRLVRGEVIKHREQTYVVAARTLGFSHMRILFKHILPNITHIIIINFTYRFPAAINTEVILSFLGIGAQGEPSWGIMINSARLRLWHGVWWEMTFVTLAIFFIVLAFNLLGDALRDALDPRLKDDRS